MYIIIPTPLGQIETDMEQETPNEPLPNSGNSEVPLTRSDWDADKIINSDPPQVKQAVHDDLEDGEIGLDDDVSLDFPVKVFDILTMT